MPYPLTSTGQFIIAFFPYFSFIVLRIAIMVVFKSMLQAIEDGDTTLAMAWSIAGMFNVFGMTLLDYQTGMDLSICLSLLESPLSYLC